MMLSESTILEITKKAKPEFQQAMLDNMNQLLDMYEINTSLRIAHFLAQALHESGEFSINVENLNYSSQGLLRIFSKYFNSEEAMIYARKPQAIANRVYSNRMGNGSENSNDGWNYRGRGIFQLTGKANYKKYGDILGIDLISNPDAACDPIISFQVACEYWKANKLNMYADIDDIYTITRKINGGLNGIEDRIHQYQRISSLL